MKRAYLMAAVSAALFMAWATTQQAAPPQEKLLRHVVLFKFKDSAGKDKVAEVVKAFGELPSKISEIQSFEWGTDVSPEKKSKGLTHCFFLTFKTEAARDAYIIHPDHKAFGALVGPTLDDVTVVDYWTN